ncbi:MAG: nucleotidyl transferase AbiEii/AbiGii toxin family protein [Sphingomonadaceae bacterium]|nr:nucleotidyl transferase AbiEii/AbiGii toxin family protein [Sphingomonadaceae bacterium]
MYEPKQTPQARTANFQAWEDAAARDKQTHRERVASEVFLAALGSTENFREKIILKGGVLVGAVYESGRNTADLDFSTTLEPSMDFLKKLEAELIAALPSAAALVGSPDTIIKVQSVKYRPRPDTFIDADAPAIEVKFAFAERGTKDEAKLNSGTSNNIIYADISFNEQICNIDEICIGSTGISFFAYSKCDLVAEKLRSILQQKTRKRNRRQDVYDLWFLIKNYPINYKECSEIKNVFLQKSRSRGIEPDENSLNDREIIERSQSEWDTLASEVQNLPNFDTAFETVSEFYSMLWATTKT